MGKKWFSHVLKTAKSSYKKSKRGGGDDDKVAFAPTQVRKRGGEVDLDEMQTKDKKTKTSFESPPTPVSKGGRKTRRHSRR